MLYLLVFSMGLGSQPPTVNAEIHPLPVRSGAMSLVMVASNIISYALSAFFLTATESSLGKVIIYLSLGLFCVIAWFFVYTMLPETKGKRLDEVTELFLSPEKKQMIKDLARQKESMEDI